MTYVIAEPRIDVKDKACIQECPVERICEGERMLYIHPGECAGWGACEPVRAVEAIFYKERCARAVGSVHRRERQVLRSARLARWRRQDRSAALRHRVCRQRRRGAVARGVLAQQWRGGRANADPAAGPPAEEAAATASMRAGPGPQVAPTFSPARREPPSLGTGDRRALPARGPPHTRRCRPAGRDPLAPTQPR